MRFCCKTDLIKTLITIWNDEEISSAVSYALNKGFQIHPDALEILHKIDVKELGQIIKDVVKEKTKTKAVFDK